MSSRVSKDDAYYRAFHTSDFGPMWIPTSRERHAFHVDMKEYVNRSLTKFRPKTRTSTTAIATNYAQQAHDNELTRPMNEGFHAVFRSGARAYINTNPGASHTNNNNNTYQDFDGLGSNTATTPPPAASTIPSGTLEDDVNKAPIGDAASSADQQFIPEDEQYYYYNDAMPEMDQHSPPQFESEYFWEECTNVALTFTGTTSPHSCGDSAYTTHTHSPIPGSSGRCSSSHSNENSDDGYDGDDSSSSCDENDDVNISIGFDVDFPLYSNGNSDDGYDGDDSSSSSDENDDQNSMSAGLDADSSLYQHAEEMHHLQHMNRHSRSSRTPTPPPCDTTAPRERRERQPFVHGDEHMRPVIQQARYALMTMRPLHDRKMFCKFCKNKGEEPRVYSTHLLNDSDGRVVCPILQRYICSLCGATGYDAHTIKYCPYNEFDIGDAMDRMLASMGDA